MTPHTPPREETWPHFELELGPDCNDQQMAPVHAMRTVHWHLRDGFCDCLQTVGRCGNVRSVELAKSLQTIERLVQACEALYQAEHNALAAIRYQPDSSWANRDLVWGAHVLAEKVRLLTSSAEPVSRSHLDSLQQYLALFFGELLVQLHAKEATLTELMRQKFGISQCQVLLEGLTDVLAMLRPRVEPS